MQKTPDGDSAGRLYAVCKLCGAGDLERHRAHPDLVRCARCGLVFAATRHRESDLAAVYQELYSRAGAYSPHLQELDRLRRGEEVPLGWNRRTLISELRRRKVRDVAELGAGVGVVARSMERAQGISYVGYEPETETARAAADAGLAVREGGWRQMLEAEGAESQDAVIAFEVLEHVQELRETLEGLRQVLRPGGYLAFSVPNFDRRLDFEPPDRLHQDPPPIHLNFWNPASLKRTLELADFEPVTVRVRTRPYFEPRRALERAPLYWRWLTGRLHGPTLLAIARRKSSTPR
ncbi:MAG: class I SAM-dependent methyltransferase [Acidobacteriota bacterium]